MEPWGRMEEVLRRRQAAVRQLKYDVLYGFYALSDKEREEIAKDLNETFSKAGHGPRWKLEKSDD